MREHPKHLFKVNVRPSDYADGHGVNHGIILTHELQTSDFPESSGRKEAKRKSAKD